MTLFAELKRRNVVRVGLAYAVIGWILAQIAEFAFENFGAPEWVLKSVVVVILLGLPISLFFAWAYEITPEGVKREEEVDRSQSITHTTGRKLDFVIIGTLVLALAYFVWERQPNPEAAADVTEVDVAEIGEDIKDESVEPEPVDGPAARSIAVLPFVNMSSDQEQEWFSDGLTEELLNALARTPDLLVAARTSSFKFKGANEDITTIAKALGVAHILEGSVRSGGDQLRVTAQLIRASDGFHLWSQTYDRNPEDVIAIQEEIAIEIATALETAMDPDALANMVSSGTRSVPAFNAYLQGLAYGASMLSTGDAYTFLGARDSFERAIDLDPDFSLAYWRLAIFWQIQMSTTNMIAGIVELPYQEMHDNFIEAIEKAIETERDPVNANRYRVIRATNDMKMRQALRLNTEVLEQLPNDQDAQNRQLNLLADQSLDDELSTAISRYQERDGYDVVVVQASMLYLLMANDKEAIRAFVKTALERVGDNPFVVYQAHRALLWAGDLDGASRLLRLIQSSDLPSINRKMVTLRQACAEDRLTDATRLYEQIVADDPDEVSTLWIADRIMGNDQDAINRLAALDDNEDLSALGDFMSYAFFDARPFPNLMALLEAQGVTPRQPLEIPYRCKT
jgi:TolB-like protein/tetratricopeptide (TPR) repeat protein